MNDEMIILTVILLMGYFLGYTSNKIVDNIYMLMYKIRLMRETNAAFKIKQAEVTKMKAAGDFHEWQEIPTMQGSMMVCKKTGWCPSLNGFIERSRIESYLNDLKREEEYKDYRANRVQQLCQALNMSTQQVEKVVEDVFSIKKDFHLMKAAQLQQELKEKAAHVESQGNKV